MVTTAVEADIHYPTDSALIGDEVRVLFRLLRKAESDLVRAAAGGIGAGPGSRGGCSRCAGTSG